MKKLSMRHSSVEVKITIIVFFTIFALYSLICLYPLFWTTMNALKTADEYFENSTALPKNWLFGNFIRVFSEFVVRDYTYVDMLWNSLWMLVVKVFVNVGASVILAYPLARFRFPGSHFLYWLVIVSNTIPIIGSGAAGYKLMMDLNMINNPSLIWLAWAGGFDFAFIVFYGTFKGMSMFYSEAAKIDGASNLTVLFRVILPQALPCIVAIAITQAIGAWNDYSTSMISMREYPTLAYGLYLFNTEANYIEDSKPIFYCAAIISCIPVFIVYGCNLKRIMTNVTAGGLKG